MGPWAFVDRRLGFILEELRQTCEKCSYIGKGDKAAYVGRKAAASPATGLHKTHVAEQALLVQQALAAPLASLPQPFRRVTKMGKAVNAN
jgi:2-oxoglutarate dehydrogenase E1 component